MNQTADLTEKTLSREEKYQGSFLSLHVDQVQLPNGRTSFREVVEHVDGVAILALDDRNNVLTVTQYRYVIGKTLLEIPAGKLEPGEDPVAGALRELKEETGAVPDTFLPMGADPHFYPSASEIRIQYRHMGCGGLKPAYFGAVPSFFWRRLLDQFTATAPP